MKQIAISVETSQSSSKGRNPAKYSKNAVSQFLDSIRRDTDQQALSFKDLSLYSIQ